MFGYAAYAKIDYLHMCLRYSRLFCFMTYVYTKTTLF